MTPVALVIVWALPLAAALLCLVPATRGAAFAAAPAAALPALLLPLLAPPGGELHWPAALLGMRLAFDPVAWTFVLVTGTVGLLGALALAATMRDDPRRFRFAAFYLAGLAGNLGVALAYDVVTFYTFFALMSFAAYGLVIHAGDGPARRAGAIYIVMVVLAEGLLLGGLLLTVATGAESLAEVPRAVAGSTHRHWIIALLLAGFGVKAGLLPWHVSLPPAYAVVPAAGGVLLGGAMLHAGLLGWLRLLPFGAGTFPAWGGLLAFAGLAGMYYGVALGLLQTRAGAVLGYSSISQMGFMLVALGLALAEPRLWSPALGALLVYAAHHALIKATLFLGAGAAVAGRARPLVLAALLLPSLMLAGLPLTTGAIAKLGLKAVAASASVPWSGIVGVLYAFGALGTALLMLRFLAALRHEPAVPVPRWRLLVLAGVGAFVLTWLVVARMPQVDREALGTHWRDPAVLWSETWPVLAATALAWGWGRMPSWHGRIPAVPPGDLVVPLVRVWRRLVSLHRRGRLTLPHPSRPALAPMPASWQAALQRWSVGSLLFLLMVAALALLLVR